MSLSIKSVSATQLQDAIAEVVSGLTGKVCAASVSDLKFNDSESLSFLSKESASLTVTLTLSEPTSDEPAPF
jgi:hypothetical protein